MWINKKLGRVIAVTACVVSVVVGGASIGGAEQVGPRVSNVHKDTWLDQYHPNSVSDEAEWIKGGYLFDKNPLIPSDWGGYPVYTFEEEMGKEILRLLGLKVPYRARPVAFYQRAGIENHPYDPNGYVQPLISPGSINTALYVIRDSPEARDALVNPLLWKEIRTGRKYWPYGYRFEVESPFSLKDSERLNYRIPKVFSGVWGNEQIDGVWSYCINLFAKKGAPFVVVINSYASSDIHDNNFILGVTITSPYVVDYGHVSSSIEGSNTWWARGRRGHDEKWTEGYVS